MGDFRLKLGKGLMELIGTGVLLFTIQICVGLGTSYAAFAIGGAVCIMVYTAAPVSGGHINPSVSLAVTLRGKMSAHEMAMYMTFQIVGGTMGAMLGGFIVGTYSIISVGENSTFLQALIAEVTFTFLITFVVLGVATHSKTDGNQYFGMAIGLVVTAGAIAIGPISGCAINPAVALGLSIAKGFANFTYVGSVVVAELLGSVMAAMCFYLVASEEFDEESPVSIVVGTADESTPLKETPGRKRSKKKENDDVFA